MSRLLERVIQTTPGERFVQFMRTPRGKKLDLFLVRRFGWSLLMTVFAAKVGYPPMPIMIVHSIGRLSGEERSAVMPYIPFQGTNYLLGGNGGRERDPHWVDNLRSNPAAHATIGCRKRPVTAREVLPGSEEYAAVWAHAQTRSPQYERYQQGMVRRTPIIALES